MINNLLVKQSAVKYL